MGVVNASRNAIHSARFFSSAACSRSRTAASRRCVAAGPSHERVEAFTGHGHLLAEHAEQVGRLREEPALRQLGHLHSATSRARARPRRGTAQIGSVVIHVDADLADDGPADAAPAVTPGADADDRRRDDLGRADRRADARLDTMSTSDEPVSSARPSSGSQPEDPPADGPDDRPSAERRPERQRQRAGELGPRRRGEAADAAVGEQHDGHDTDGLRRVVRAVAEREHPRHDPLAGTHAGRARGRSRARATGAATGRARSPATKPAIGAMREADE